MRHPPLMDTLIHADIFFFVATICMALVAVFIVIALIYMLRILDDVKRVSSRARAEGDFFMDEIHAAAERMKRRKTLVGTIGALIILGKRLVRRHL